MENILTKFETANFKAFNFFYNVIYYSLLLVIISLISAPAFLSMIGAYVVLTGGSKVPIVESIISGEAFNYISNNATIVGTLITIIFVFLTNSSAAFARIPGIGEEDVDRFKNAAYGFMLCTILILLSIGVYAFYFVNKDSMSQKLSSNVIVLLLSILALILFSFGSSLGFITAVYGHKLVSYFESKRMQKESFKIIEGSDVYSIVVSILFWLSIWIWVFKYVTVIVNAIMGLNAFAFILQSGFTLFIIRRWFAGDYDSREVRLSCSVVLLLLLPFASTLQ